MKKYFVIFFALLTALPAAAQFQPKHDVVKFHMLHLFGSTLKGGYEHFNQGFTRSFVIQLGYTGSNMNNPRSGAEAEIQFRLYPAQTFSSAGEEEKSYYHGFYFSPFAGYRYLERTEFNWWGPGPSSEYGAYYNSFRFGTNLGYQFTIFNNIFFDASMGGGVKIGSHHFSPGAPPRNPNRWDPSDDGILWPGYTGVYPRVDFAIGFAF